MKKRMILAAALAAAVLLAGAGVLYGTRALFRKPAPEKEPDDSFTYYERDGVIVFSGCTENPTEIVIPAEINGLPVRILSENAFAGGFHWNLEKVVLPDSVESIGSCAFEDCAALREVNIEHVREIGDGAFCGCERLETLCIGRDTGKIGERAFGGSRVTLTLDDANSCYRMTDGCLYTADGKTLVRANPEVKSYTVPEGVTTIASGAFELTDLQSITIPSHVTAIGEYAFYDCLGLTGIEIPGSVKRIEDYTFTYCQNLTSVKLHRGLTHIGREAFCDDFRLTSMTVPSSVKEIGGCAIGYYYYDGDSCMLSNDFTLYVYPGSAAERYAKENKLHYKRAR